MSNILEVFIPLLPQLVIGLITLIIVCVRKPKMVRKDTIFTMVLKALPGLINKAEDKFIGGQSKLDAVKLACYDYLKELTGMDILELHDIYDCMLTKAIEDILSTPQKKGVSTDEK